MNIILLIAQHLLEVHEGGNWTEVNMMSVLADVTAEEATTLTDASPNTIEALVHHLSYWNRVMIQRIDGVAVEVPEDNGFNRSAELTDEAWQEVKRDNIASAYELSHAMMYITEPELPEPLIPGYSSAYKNLQGAVEHVHYHLGQIVVIKKLLRSA